MKALPLVVAVVCFIIAIFYLLGVLQIGAHEPGPHYKHGVLFILLGVLSLVWMRFQTKSARTGVR